MFKFKCSLIKYFKLQIKTGKLNSTLFPIQFTYSLHNQNHYSNHLNLQNYADD